MPVKAGELIPELAKVYLLKLYRIGRTAARSILTLRNAEFPLAQIICISPTGSYYRCNEIGLISSDPSDTPTM